ncbi:MAG: lipase family protein [Leptolyngbya sp. SIO1D8]|nr:lipase family protein [Leptolyngbya sp. SIO1D8]
MGSRLASITRLAFLGMGIAVSVIVSATAVLSMPALAVQEPEINQRILAQSQLVAQWLAAFALLGGAIAAITGIDQYRKQCKWRRREHARHLIEMMSRREAIQNIAAILDYEEYRTFEVRLSNGQILQFEATDERLKRALRSHAQMVKTRQGIKMLSQVSAQPGKMDEGTARILQRYRDEEFVIELTLRDWFDDFLGALESCNNSIEAGLVTAEDLKPFIFYWLQVISDRRFRRNGGSGFYDQFFHYIYWSDYKGVQKLFERYGYKILPPPYSTNDFDNIEKETPVYDAFRALCMAKAAHLVYEDEEYVHDIVSHWLSDNIDDVWKKQNPADYVVDTIKQWLRAEDRQKAFDIQDEFKYLVDRVTDTQAFMFRKDSHIVLIFRGSQQAADWKTNFKFRLREFAMYQPPKSGEIPTGKVHRGFQTAWEGVEKRVIIQLKKWWGKDTHFWVAGHSLGGALAALAATSLDYQGFRVSGLYTFGQPRVGDWKFTRQVNARMGDRMFRYVNNNDVVPLIPPQFNILNPTHMYGHMGQFRYFNVRGKLYKNSFFGQQWGDRLLGFILAIKQPGTDIVADHMMEFYVRNLQKALNEEKERQKSERQEKMEAAELFELEKAR